MPPLAEALAARFWPGPLTLILPKAPDVNGIVTGGQDSIGVRVPSHPWHSNCSRLSAAESPRPRPIGTAGSARPAGARARGIRRCGARRARRRRGPDRPRIDDRLVPGRRRPSAAARFHHPLADRKGRWAARRRPGRSARSRRPAVPLCAGTPLEIVAADEFEARAGELASRAAKVAVLAMRPPLHAQRHMTWINAGKKADTYAHNLQSPAHAGSRRRREDTRAGAAGRRSVGRGSGPPAARERLERPPASKSVPARCESRESGCAIAGPRKTSASSWIPARIRSRANRCGIWSPATVRRCSSSTRAGCAANTGASRAALPGSICTTR